ncbi:MAG: carboxypeptidase-like regulatory domain-containing protein [Verrucomicrobia bacterium]|nr:carboxypeptidase-like regulatory domain-containing protein [Verrucomicrobiota bacterium]
MLSKFKHPILSASGRYFTALILIVILLAFPGPLIAADSGGILGIIQDPAGSFVQGAIVTVPGTNLRAVSDRQGVVRFDNLPVGQTEIRSTHLGFRPTIRYVEVRANEVVTVRIGLLLDDGVQELEILS